MTTKAKHAISSPDGLSDHEAHLMTYCARERSEMVHIIDVATALAGLPKSLSGQWFDRKLLDPKQTVAVREADKEITRAIRRLFRAGLIDIGREEVFSEGFRRHHREIIESMRSGQYWRSRPQFKGQVPSLRVVEDHVAHHEQWAHATDFNAVVREMGGKPELVGLTDDGEILASSMGSDA
jgi:hypothetical protein